MGSQRRLARKVKGRLRSLRQRSRKLPFAHRSHTKPRTRRTRLQDLLPRNTIPLREDRAQALVPFHNVPKRCFQRRNIKLATKDRKSTRLNSSHLVISYAVFCLKK